MALSASKIVSATASGCETLMAWDAPASSLVPREPARSAPARCTAAGMFRSYSPKTNHEGVSFHAGVSAGSGSERAASVTGRWVAAMSAASSAETSAAN